MEVTWGIAFKVWWAWMWRVLIVAGLGGFMTGVGLAAIGDNPLFSLLLNLVALVIIIGGQIFIFRILLSKDFSNFKVSVVPKENPAPPVAPPPQINLQ